MRLTVTLSESEFAAVRQLAKEDYRCPGDLVRWLIAKEAESRTKRGNCQVDPNKESAEQLSRAAGAFTE